MDNLLQIVNNLQQIGLERKQQQKLSQKVVVELSAILEQFLAWVNVLIELFLALAWSRGSISPDTSLPCFHMEVVAARVFPP